nr:hypothetical protein [Candidatus Microthrix sp.]
MAAEYQEHFGEHAYDDEGNFIGSGHRGEGPSETEEAWTAYYARQGDAPGSRGRRGPQRPRVTKLRPKSRQQQAGSEA